MRITFELEPGDIERFHEALARAERRVACAEECDIVDAAKHALDNLPIGGMPGYVRQRIVEVQRLILMIEDADWALPQAERAEVLRALAYFGDPEDMIPDHVEVIGLLDDAIMLELLLKRLRHALVAYADFCAYRTGLPASAEPASRRDRLRALVRRREGLHARMRRRAAAEAPEADPARGQA